MLKSGSATPPRDTDTSPGGWDSEIMAYPYVVRVNGRLVLFYKGNRFGAVSSAPPS